MTRPTDCTTSTTESRGFRKMAQSRAGTSTPSERHLALVRMRHSFSSLAALALSHESFWLRSTTFMVPSTCSAKSRGRLTLPPSSSAMRENSLATSLECLMLPAKASAVRMGLGSDATSALSSSASRLPNPVQQPTILTASSRFSSSPLSPMRDCRLKLTWRSSTAMINTL